HVDDDRHRRRDGGEDRGARPSEPGPGARGDRCRAARVHAARRSDVVLAAREGRVPRSRDREGRPRRYGRCDRAASVLLLVRPDAVLLGSPTVADLNGDGWPEISVTDYAGFLYVWNHDGTQVHGFPVQVNRAYSHVPGCETPGIGPNCDEFVAHPVRDHINVVNGAFTAQPAAGKIDPSYPGLDLIAGAEDGHLYAWHADGTPVPGWPVMLRDPKKVQSVDPVSHRITFKPGANAAYGRQVIAGVSLGDVNGDGI